MQLWYFSLVIFLTLLSTSSSFHLFWKGKSVDTVSRYITFQVYYGKNPGEYTSLPFLDRHNLTETRGFNASHNTIFYYPGWGDYPRPDNMRKNLKALVPAFRSLPETNLVVLDYWDLVKHSSYLDSVMNATYIGELLGQFYLDLIPRIQAREKVRLIGFSLGCQIISHIAKHFIAAGQKFHRITGMDPAGPGFKLTSHHLKASDADYVDIMHSNANAMGLAGLGTINYYINGGTLQPPCVNLQVNALSCSHHMVWKVYVESFNNPKGFPAKKCTNLCQATFPLCSCDDEDIAYIGYNQDTNKTGDYFFITNLEPPYAMGDNGTWFNKPNFILKKYIVTEVFNHDFMHERNNYLSQKMSNKDIERYNLEY